MELSRTKQHYAHSVSSQGILFSQSISRKIQTDLQGPFWQQHLPTLTCVPLLTLFGQPRAPPAPDELLIGELLPTQRILARMQLSDAHKPTAHLTAQHPNVVPLRGLRSWPIEIQSGYTSAPYIATLSEQIQALRFEPQDLASACPLFLGVDDARIAAPLQGCRRALPLRFLTHGAAASIAAPRKRFLSCWIASLKPSVVVL
mmetsp:Transcript_97254/g.152001  ORF Transcript_97254/g.152001 Transcript_97254/m.152001 type:complete len:202 (+) Transcript_97254:619-1224(+)